MRIAIVAEYLHARGGTQRQALELAKHLKDAGHDIIVFCLVFDRNSCFPEINKYLTIKYVREARPLSRRMFAGNCNLRVLSRVRSLLWKKIGLNYLRDYRIMWKSTQHLFDMIAHSHEKLPFDVINAHDYGPAAWASALISEAKEIPSVWQCNDPLLRWDNSNSYLARSLKKWLISKDCFFASKIDVITVLDSQVAKVVSERYNKEAIVVRSGVDINFFSNLPDKYRARERLKLPQGKTIILVLSLLNSPHRRVEDVVAAHAYCSKDTWLLLAATDTGNKKYVSMIKSVIHESPARNRIIWLKRPLRGENELLDLFAAGDIFVFPNVNQTWGLAAIEAAAAGLPIVVSEDAGVHEVFSDQENAVWYRGGDVNDLVVNLLPLINNSNFRKSIAIAGRQFVGNNFSWSRYARNMEDIFAVAQASYRD